MFTIEQIHAVHARVKSGADFPRYIQELKALGVVSYEHFVADGHIRYKGKDDYSVTAGAKWPPATISETPDADALKYSISIHQQGQTDYPTFCRQAAEAGVEKWIIDIPQMSCTYFDKSGNTMLTEAIPEFEGAAR